ncbi:MAG: pilin [Candidatus Pacebacteria bacterium]|nr:pilin [Candidatus Paceibacterota bacterium]
MKIKTMSIALLLLFLAFPVAAADDNLVAGIPKDASAAELIAYFFNLGIMIGAFIAVVIIVMAGIEWMMSDGNPGKIESAKDKIKNTLLGVAILMGCYLILGVINPQLTTIKINKLYCTQGIAVMAKMTKDGKETVSQTCITQSMPNYSTIGEITSTLDWNFLPNTLLSVYVYSEEDYKGTMTEFSCENGGCSGNFGDVTGSKSIYLLPRSVGLYLFDQPDFKPGSKMPFSTSSSISNMASGTGFDNLASSIKIVNPDPAQDTTFYQAIVFDGPNWTGKCSFLAQSIKDLNTANGGYYPTPIKNGTLSSLIVAKTVSTGDPSEYTGYITLYNKPSCSAGSSSELRSCVIRTYGQWPLATTSNCSELNGEVMSLSITGRFGIALISNNGECRYYDINSVVGEGACQSSTPTAIYDPAGARAESYIMLPVEKR